MKRYNIHLDPEWIAELDKISIEIREVIGDQWPWSDFTRSDLIRIAIAKYFNLEKVYTHYDTEGLLKAIKKVLKKRARGKSVSIQPG